MVGCLHREHQMRFSAYTSSLWERRAQKGWLPKVGLLCAFPTGNFPLLHHSDRVYCGLQIWLIGSSHSTSVASKGHAGSLAFIPRGRRVQGSGILTYLQPWRTQRADLWFGRPCTVKSQPSLSLHIPWACQKPLHFLLLKKSSAVLESSPEHHGAGKIPQSSLTVGKKMCWTISGTIETGFYFCSFLESCSSLLL